MKWGSPWGGLWGAGVDPTALAWQALAESRVLWQHPRSEPARLVGLAGLCGSLAGMEIATIDAMVQAFSIDDATGAMLDVIGRILSTPRAGALDDDYRVALKVAVLYLVSSASADQSWSGTCESVLAIARLLVPSATAINLTNAPPYSFSLSITPATNAQVQQVMRAVCRGLWAGVLGQSVIGTDGTTYGSVSASVATAGIYGSASVSVGGAAQYGYTFTTSTGDSSCG